MNPVGIGGGGIREVMELRQQVLERAEALRTLREAAAGGAPAPAPSPGGGFADALKGAVEEVNAAQARSSAVAAAYERGEVTDVAQVMLARQESSIAFEATLQVRNKLLSAYQDIMQMGV